MKKFLCGLLAGTMLLTFAACETDKDGSEKKAKKGNGRCVDISKGIKKADLEAGTRDSFSYAFDFDGDGKKEDVEIEIVELENDWTDEVMRVRVGEEYMETETCWADIGAVYVCDIEQDGVKDLAIITVEYSGDPQLRILDYSKELMPRSFWVKDRYEDDLYWTDQVSIGYVDNFDMRIEGNILTVREQTDSYGMWHIERTYVINEEGVMVQEVKEQYEILPDDVNEDVEDYYRDEMSEQEFKKWKKGYYMAHTNFGNEDITVEKGEYFRILYDDCQDHIYIEKESGEGSWFYIYYDAFDGYAINRYLFAVAG